MIHSYNFFYVFLKYRKFDKTVLLLVFLNTVSPQFRYMLHSTSTLNNNSVCRKQAYIALSVKQRNNHRFCLYRLGSGMDLTPVGQSGCVVGSELYSARGKPGSTSGSHLQERRDSATFVVLFSAQPGFLVCFPVQPLASTALHTIEHFSVGKVAK